MLWTDSMPRSFSVLGCQKSGRHIRGSSPHNRAAKQQSTAAGTFLQTRGKDPRCVSGKSVFASGSVLSRKLRLQGHQNAVLFSLIGAAVPSDIRPPSGKPFRFTLQACLCVRRASAQPQGWARLYWVWHQGRFPCMLPPGKVVFSVLPHL